MTHRWQAPIVAGFARAATDRPRARKEEITVHRLTRLALVNTVLLVCVVSCAQSSGSGSAPAADQPVATFGDQVVTAQQLKEMVGSRTMQLENQIFQQKVAAIEQHVFEKLLEAEASTKDMSAEEYFKAEVDGKVGEPTAEQIEQVLNQYRRQLPPDEEQAKVQVVAFLKQQQQRELDMGLRKRLFDSAGLKILLDAPRAEVKVDDWNPSRGPAGAPVTLMEFTDFQCPYCGRVQTTLDEVMKRYDGKVRHVFKQLPLDMHPQAKMAAMAGLCAQDQGKFWELHDWMFQNPAQISRETVEGAIAGLGADMEQFTACLNDNRHLPKVMADLELARSLGFSGTPAFLVNGRAITGAQPLESFVSLIEEELERKGITPPKPEAPAAPEG